MAGRKQGPRTLHPKLPAGHMLDLSVYADSHTYMERAKESPKGIRITFATPRDAQAGRLKLYWFRRCDRSNNRLIYPQGDPMHGKSVYDDLMVAISGCVVTIYHRPPDPEVEEL